MIGLKFNVLECFGKDCEKIVKSKLLNKCKIVVKYYVKC